MTTPKASSEAVDVATRLIDWEPPQLAGQMSFPPDQISVLVQIVALTIELVHRGNDVKITNITLPELHKAMTDTSGKALPAGIAEWLEIASQIVYLHITAVDDASPNTPARLSEFTLARRLQTLASDPADPAPRPAPPRRAKAAAAEGEFTVWTRPGYIDGEPVILLGQLCDRSPPIHLVRRTQRRPRAGGEGARSTGTGVGRR